MILIICAMNEEREAFRKHLNDLKVLEGRVD